MTYVTVDVGRNGNRIPVWDNFISHLYETYPDKLKEYNSYRYYLDIELRPYKAIYITDEITYFKLIFDNEKYKTLFFIKWS